MNLLDEPILPRYAADREGNGGMEAPLTKLALAMGRAAPPTKECSGNRESASNVPERGGACLRGVPGGGQCSGLQVRRSGGRASNRGESSSGAYVWKRAAWGEGIPSQRKVTAEWKQS